ncbi:ArsR/SmtB family transcription factor [Virgibacillus byunsanensis]|uniref:ArsR/SmtB family transcription factor n=1 Tax=Virgibacillus byunsanensis TaxID=570945 RepID=A0ABW3LJX0_9BACI
MAKDMCEVTCIHEDRVSRVKEQIIDQPFSAVATMYKLLADQNRLQIAYALLLEEELCVCDIANIIGATTATTSHHLRQLHKTGIATYRKEGKLVYYSLVDHHIKQLIQQAFSHMKEHPTYAI